jgi:hypothetical protein
MAATWLAQELVGLHPGFPMWMNLDSLGSIFSSVNGGQDRYLMWRLSGLTVGRRLALFRLKLLFCA